ncbi:signal peptidase II [Halioglobus japonicus]|uniref:Lipoprotein signal peptidase n=1 Tax=Halioglobus japonicus TaxID=930805 RepID=A0AAP8MFY2_9GAMM|nr:signal peptidase II [Halioglobus japonicus]AQA20198.1 signal peptidase II [Halioglobus japonicus]PLW86949.1 signal peptidase II [Halioglobus japonicus]GHD14221.1 lipoprotein signal peptidase [Halioglobus japonicus]
MLKRAFLVAMIALSVVGCDQTTKHIAQSQLAHDKSHSYFYDSFRLTYAENTGAFLSLGSKLPDTTRFAIFSILVGGMLLGAIIYTLTSPSLTSLEQFGWSVVIGGGLGNLHDRIFNNGAVIDFLNLGIGSVRTGIFNIADMAILLGIALILWPKRRAS